MVSHRAISGFPIEGGMTIPLIATFDPGTYAWLQSTWLFQVTGIPPDAQEIRTNGELVTSLGPQPMVQTVDGSMNKNLREVNFGCWNGYLSRPMAMVWSQTRGVFKSNLPTMITKQIHLDSWFPPLLEWNLLNVLRGSDSMPLVLGGAKEKHSSWKPWIYQSGFLCWGPAEAPGDLAIGCPWFS